MTYNVVGSNNHTSEALGDEMDDMGRRFPGEPEWDEPDRDPDFNPDRDPDSDQRAPGREEINWNLHKRRVTDDEVSRDLSDIIPESGGGSGRGDETLPPPPWHNGKNGGGIDACAWYLSFRYGNVFGIYICQKCLIYIAKQLVAAGVSRKIAPQSAFTYLYTHEMFHHRVDRAVQSIEEIVELHSGNNTTLWLSRWNNGPYNSRHGAIHLLEEALANVDGWRCATKLAGDKKNGGTPSDRLRVKKTLARLMLTQGPGYRDFALVDRPNILVSQARLLSCYTLLARNVSGARPKFVKTLRLLLPQAVRKGVNQIDPSVPLYFVDC